MRPLSLATIFIHGPFWALLYMIAGRCQPHSFYALKGVMLGVRMLMAAVMIGRGMGKAQALSDVLLIPFKDLVMTAVYFTGLTGKTVQWGGRRFRLMDGGIMRELA